MTKGELKKALDKLPCGDDTEVVTPTTDNDSDLTNILYATDIYQVTDKTGYTAVVIKF